MRPHEFCLQSEALPRAREAASVAQLLDGLLGGVGAGRLDTSRRAMAAWLMSNGDMERRHTVRVWLRDSPRRGLDPTMVVEVDSHSLVSDFNARRDLYLGRLAFYGQRVSRLEFRFALRTTRVGAVDGAGGGADAGGAANVRAHISAADRARADELALKVPESLRPAVSRALAASLCRSRLDAGGSGVAGQTGPGRP